MNNQRIMTINAKALFKYFPRKRDTEKASFILDTRKKSLSVLVAKEVNEMEECPLFYQISAVLNQDDNYQPFKKDDNYKLYDQLIIMDFDDIFMPLNENTSEVAQYTKKKQQKNVEALMENGLRIIFSDEHIVDMIPFDKSGNMSRNSRISFVNKKYSKEINERLNLGMDFSGEDGIKVNLSKYYAYRGLYLSTSSRVEHDNFKLTPETIIIVKDYREASGESYEHDVTVISAEQSKTSKNDWVFKTPEKHERKTIATPYDGEGVVTEEYANYINESLHIMGGNSFQIRLPFAKGMVHQVDVTGFINEFTQKGSEDEKYTYNDAFGIDRDLQKAHIFLTESMFKCKEWLIDHCAKKGIKDPMEYYCKMLKDYEHSLYISGTNIPYGHSKCTHLSYQTINTLAFSEQGITSVLEGHGKLIKNPIEYLNMMDESENNSTTSVDKDTTYNVPNWKKAVRKDPALAGDLYIKTQLENTQKNLISKLATGKVLVTGQTRYLCRDLLPLLISLLNEEGDIKDAYLRKLYTRFYLPQGKNAYLFLNFEDYYAFFRNPHLSRNEQALMRAFVLPNSKEKYANDGSKNEKYYGECVKMYDKYFGHLTGIVMVPSGSTMPLCLGGADFDGDLVSIVTNQSVVDAVKRGAYTYMKSPSLDWYKRRIPAIEIPSTKAKEQTVPENVEYSHIYNTFANHIGRISNAAIAIGQDEYERNNNNDPEYDTSKATCDKCTLLTGLEIDAAKNGVHPNLDIILNSDVQKSMYLDFLSQFKKLKAEEKFVFENLKVTEEKEIINNVEKNVIFLTAKDCETEVKWYQEEEKKGTYINWLPKYFFEYLKMYKGGKGSKDKYKMEKAPLGKLGKEKIKVFKQKSEIIFAIYNFYNNILLRELKKEKKRGFYAVENIEVLISRIYDENKVDEILFKVLPGIKEKIEQSINIDIDVQDIRQRINDTQWQFQPYDNRGKVLEKIIGGSFEERLLSKPEKEVLYYFNHQGYKLLWRIIELIEGPSIASFDDVYDKALEIIHYEQVGEFEDLDVSIKEELREYYENNTINIDQMVYQLCLKELKKLIIEYAADECTFENKAPIIEALYQNTKSTMYKAKFFWDAFSWEDLVNVFGKGGDKEC